MHEDQLTEAMAAIAADIGPDAAEFSPPGQKNFLTEAALLGMAGTFLLSMFKGMAKKISEKIAEKIGDQIGGAVVDAGAELIDRLRHKTPPASEQEVRNARDEVASVARDPRLSAAEIEAISRAVADELIKALSVRSDAAVSRRVVSVVRAEGLKAVSG